MGIERGEKLVAESCRCVRCAHWTVPVRTGTSWALVGPHALCVTEASPSTTPSLLDGPMRATRSMATNAQPRSCCTALHWKRCISFFRFGAREFARRDASFKARTPSMRLFGRAKNVMTPLRQNEAPSYKLKRGPWLVRRSRMIDTRIRTHVSITARLSWHTC